MQDIFHWVTPERISEALQLMIILYVPKKLFDTIFDNEWKAAKRRIRRIHNKKHSTRARYCVRDECQLLPKAAGTHPVTDQSLSQLVSEVPD